MMPAAPCLHAASRRARGRQGTLLATLVVLGGILAGCGSAPLRSNENLPAGSWPNRDGPEPHPPSGLEQVPDATPQVEPIRPGGPNKPYDVWGRSYVPITQDAPYTERGTASWYGRFFHGKRTASGEVYNMYAMTAAHPTLPIPSYARVRNPANGREVIVRINDRGPFHTGRIIDLSYAAATRLGLVGVGTVEVQRITFEDIRTGAWRRDGAGEAGVTVATGPLPGPVPVPAPTATPPPASAPAPAPTAAPSALVVAAADPVVATTADVARALPAPLPAEAAPAEAGTSVSTPMSSTAAAVVVAPPASGPPPALAPAVADAPPARAYTAAARGFWVQLGAFRQREGVEGFQQRVEAELGWIAPLLAVFSDSAWYRLQAGPYPSRVDARAAAERVRDGLKLVPVIVERR